MNTITQLQNKTGYEVLFCMLWILKWVCAWLQVKKIFENEKRLQAGDHSMDLLALDFEKNYNMYIFPVHWQFGQLDQHPSDR